MTLAEVRAGYVAGLQAQGRAPATIHFNLCVLEHFGRFLEERQIEDLRTITRRDVDAYVTALAGKYRPTTQMGKLYTLRGFFEHLVDAGKLLASPAEHVRLRRILLPVGPALDPGQVDKLIASINTGLGRGIRDRALVELLWATGLRRKEVVVLAVRDVDVESRTVRVRDGKGNKDRLVPMTSEAAQWLGEYLREVRPWLVKKNRGAGDALFLCWHGRPITSSGLHTILREMGAVAKVKGVSCYSFRRTMATGLLAGGANIKAVSEVLGHGSIAPTARYTKVIPKDLRDEQDRTHPRAR